MRIESIYIKHSYELICHTFDHKTFCQMDIPQVYVLVQTTLNNQPASLLLKSVLTTTQAYFMS